MKNMGYTEGFLFQVSNAERGDADKSAMMNNREMKKND